jgi:hypothetical protein
LQVRQQKAALAKSNLTLYLVLDDDALHLRPIYLLLLVATSGPADVRASLREPRETERNPPSRNPKRVAVFLLPKPGSPKTRYGDDNDRNSRYA